VTRYRQTARWMSVLALFLFSTSGFIARSTGLRRIQPSRPRLPKLTSTSGKRGRTMKRTRSDKLLQSQTKCRSRGSAERGIRTRRCPFFRSRRTLTTPIVYERYPGASRMATSTLRHMFALHCRSPRPPDVPTFAHVPNGIGGRS
jgi:hypothetical protein